MSERERSAPFEIVGPSGNSRLRLDQPILHVGSGDLYPQDIAIGPCSNVGVAVDGTGTLHTDRVTFTGNQKGGLRVTSGAGYDIVNTVFAQNGGLALGTAFIGGAALEAPAAGRPGRFAFNTVVGNLRDGVFCMNVSQQLEASLLARQVDGTSAFPDATGCAVAPNSRALAAADPMLTPSYRITVSSPCLDAVAVPPVGAPAFDIDGVARPQGSAFDCGASELLP